MESKHKKTIWLKIYMENNMETWKTWKHGQTWQQGNMENNLSGEKIHHGMLRTCRPQGVDSPVGDAADLPPPRCGSPSWGSAASPTGGSTPWGGSPQHPKHSNQIQQIKSLMNLSTNLSINKLN